MRPSQAASIKFLNLLARTTEELGSSLNVAETSRRTVQIGVPLLGSWCALFLYDAKNARFVYQASSHRNDAEAKRLAKSFWEQQTNLVKSDCFTETIRSGLASVPQLGDEWKNFASEHPILFVPLRRAGEIPGVLCYGATTNKGFLPGDVTIAQEFANRAAMALDNSFLFERTKATEHDLQIAKAHAEQASQAKSHFLANMSHEIRTPIGAMLGFVDLLTMPEQTDEERHDWADRARINGQHLLRLINDILNLSKVESGTLELVREQVDFEAFIKDVMLTLTPQAKEHRVELRFELATPVPARFDTDATRVRQIICNLIGNAVKFTRNGDVRIEIRFDVESAAFAVTVEDSGIGLSPEQAAKLFEPFAQADVSHSRQYGGTGLGLALSRKLARLLGGDVELVTTILGKGTKFRLCFPVVVSSDVKFVTTLEKSRTNFRSTSAEGALPRLDHARLLLVDDSQDNQLFIGRMLTMAGAQVAIAGDGLSAIEHVANHDVDLIFMDIQMPGLDGYETTRRLRANGFTGPIIALTAHAFHHEQTQWRDAGCDEYMTKPVERHALLQTVVEFLDQTRNKKSRTQCQPNTEVEMVHETCAKESDFGQSIPREESKSH